MILPLIGTVFVASLVGSLHCAGMCGAFVAFAVGSASKENVPRRTLHLAYHLGRLTTYTLLGAVAGTIGGAIDFGGEYAGVSRLAATIAGVTMMVFGVLALLKVRGVRLPRPPVPRVMVAALERGHRVAMRRGPVARALIIGLMTTLLPCGWLYAFAVIAAGTGGTLAGAAVMAVFWVGTVPVLVAVGEGVRTLAGRFGRLVPELAAIAIIAVGLMSTASRLTIPAFEQPAAAQTTATPLEMARTVNDQDLPCCHDPAE
ncbi:MAG: sulfite exporter TauE/SafE family protein [Phycisphaerales bacterium]